MRKIIALVPAHNEEQNIAAAVAGLLGQDRRPDRVIVIADNCTDGTEGIAREVGAEVMVTVANRDKKAGGLNQALRGLLEELAEEDLVFVQDADTQVSKNFLADAERRFEKHSNLGAVGGVFLGEEGSGLLGVLQRNEYHRYAREIGRKQGRVMVLSGTSSCFRVAALRDVAKNRGSRIPGHLGQVYDTDALTEDNEITIALKSLGWRLVSPTTCVAITEVMPTVPDLWRQRVRWQRGAIENLMHYGWTPVTRRYWGQQAMLAFGVLALALYFTLTVITFAMVQRVEFSPLWSAIGLIFVVEKVVTAWPGGWKSRLVAAPLVIELVYDVFIQVVFVFSLLQIATRREASWGHGPVLNHNHNLKEA